MVHNASKFQESNVAAWNWYIESHTSLIIPPVSIRDKIKTDSFDMAVIEFTVLAVILHKVKRGNRVSDGILMNCGKIEEWLYVLMVYHLTSIYVFKKTGTVEDVIHEKIPAVSCI